MDQIRYAVVGSGWRAKFFLRIARTLPEQFCVTGVLVRKPENQVKITSEFGVFTTADPQRLLETGPDFVVVAVNRQDNAQVTMDFLSRGIPVLAETPASDSLEELNRMWQMHTSGCKLQVAEQYFLYPSYEAKLSVARSGALGAIQNASLSALHEYHGISILRLALGAECSDVDISAKKFTWPVATTMDRNGLLVKGGSSDQDRIRAEFAFDNGTVGFYDFCGVQYHSFIRSRHFSIQGLRGELYDESVRYLDENDDPVQESLIPSYDPNHIGWQSISFRGKPVFRNPFSTNLFSEDETAIARLLVGMKRYIETGEEIYPLRDALQDAYLTGLLSEAVRTGKTVRSEKQPWA